MPIDDAARDGHEHLVSDDTGRIVWAYWNGKHWAFSRGPGDPIPFEPLYYTE